MGLDSTFYILQLGPSSDIKSYIHEVRSVGGKAIYVSQAVLYHRAADYRYLK